MDNYDVLIIDSRYKHSLAAIRSLGMEGLRVASASEKFSPSKYSRYCKKNFRYEKKNFEKDILKILKKNKIKTVIPVDYFSNLKCSKIKNKILRYSKILIENFSKIKIVSDKKQLEKKMRNFKISISRPKTFIISSENSLIKCCKIKKGIIKSSIEERGKKIEHFNSFKELKEIYKTRKKLGPQIVQEFIEGFGCGFFAICINGKTLASFQHKRILQYPETGGVSSVAETYYNKYLEIKSKKIISELKWTGICMLEYIYDEKNNDFKFIEFNPKLWGSLDLAILSGANFPYWIYSYLVNNKIDIPNKYDQIRFQWAFPEDMLRVKASKNKIKSLGSFFYFLLSPKVYHDYRYLLIDPLPTIIKIGASFIKLIK